MKKIFFLISVLTVSIYSHANDPSIKSLLALSPGDMIGKIKGLKKEGQLKEVHYEIQTNKQIIESIKIEFHSPTSSEPYVKDDSKGFCLVQMMPGDVVMPRFFFFNHEAKIRYELLSKGILKSILIQDIPGAKTHRKCLFSEAIPKENVLQNVRKAD